MDWHKVESSTIAKIGYDAPARTMGVEFHGGVVYNYYNVSAAQAARFKKAPSTGGYHAKHIKGKFEFKKLS